MFEPLFYICIHVAHGKKCAIYIVYFDDLQIMIPKITLDSIGVEAMIMQQKDLDIITCVYFSQYPTINVFLHQHECFTKIPSIGITYIYFRSTVVFFFLFSFFVCTNPI